MKNNDRYPVNMWPIKFVDGARPDKKIKLDKPNVEKNYEDNRPPREFKEKWKEGRDWLLYDDKTGMRCAGCLDTGENIKAPKNNFITGSKNFRFSTVADHEKSISHIHASKVVASRVEAAKKTSVAHKTVLSLNEAARKQIELKFRNIHALVKNNRPISDFTWLNELDIAKGVDHGTTYNNLTAATAFLECISDVERERMKELLTGIKFFSLTMDGTCSTDSAVVEQETLFLRAAKNGKIITRFLCIGEPNSTSSADLYTFVNDSIQENGLDKHMSKLVGFGSDGAANMMGKKTGLVTLMKDDHPEMIGIHCLAHRLELAFKDIFKGDKLYIQLTTLLLGIYYFYKNSPKQRKCLKRSMEILNVKGTLPHRVCGSRWLPHMKKALGTLFKTYPAFFTQLQNASHGNAKAEGLFKMLESYNILLYAALLQEIIGPLTRLSLTLQKTDITLGDAKDMICATKELLLQIDTSDCTKFQSIVKDKEWIGHPLKVKGNELQIQNRCNTIVSALIKHIDLRYKDLNDDVLESTLIGSFRNWPCEMKSEFGVKEVKQLVARFDRTLLSQGVETEEICQEWQTMKSLLYQRHEGKFVGVSWEDVHSSLSGNGLPNILHLMDLLHSLPPTSVLNETAFNQMKLLKTDRRQRLSNKHLNDCLMIKLQSPAISEFDPKEAVDRWMLSPTGQKRRFGYQRKRAQQEEKERQTERENEREDERENERENEIDNEGEDETENEREDERENKRVRDVNSEREIESEESECYSESEESDYEQDEVENEREIRKLVLEMEVEIN